MRLVKHFLTKNPCYRAGKRIQVKGLMLHSVGCSQPKASVFLDGWNQEGFDRACVHGFIDGNDGTVYQTLPWEYRGWHCASGKKGSGNKTHIGVEMCEPACIEYVGGARFRVTEGRLEEARAVAKRTYEVAVELFAYLCREYGLDPLADGVILSHKEGYLRGIASNHGDPEHLWKGLGMGYTMDGFRRDVKMAMGEGVSDSGKAEAEEAEKKQVPYLVRVQIENLNIRKGPGTNYPKRGRFTGKGVFSIVEEADGEGAGKWGLLKAYERKRDGWISLDYGERV